MSTVELIEKMVDERELPAFCKLPVLLTHSVVKRFVLIFLLLSPAGLLAQNTEQPDPLRPARPTSTTTLLSDSTRTVTSTSGKGSTTANVVRDSITYRYRLGADGTVTAGNVSRTLLQLTGAFDWSTSRQIKFSTSPSFTYGKQSGVLAEREFFADFRTTYRHEKRVYYLGFGSVERSNLRQILGRYSLAAGAGVKLLNRKRAYVSLTDVFINESTNYASLADVTLWRNSARLYGEYAFDKDRWTISHTTFYQPALTSPAEGQPRNIRWNGTLSIQLKMSEQLSIRTLFATSYESLVVPGRKNTDLRATIGLVYERK